MKIILIFVASVFFISCSEITESSQNYSYSWTLKSDSTNIAILTIDEETYSLSGGFFSHYQLNPDTETDILPFDVSIISGRNFDDFTIQYSITSDTLFQARAYLDNSNPHHISQPKFDLPPDTFNVIQNRVQKPNTIEYFGHYLGINETILSQKSDSVWNAINNLDIVNDFNQDEFRTGIFLFQHNSNYEGPEWIIFLLR